MELFRAFKILDTDHDFTRKMKDGLHCVSVRGNHRTIHLLRHPELHKDELLASNNISIVAVRCGYECLWHCTGTDTLLFCAYLLAVC